jgi:hypothetical protein
MLLLSADAAWASYTCEVVDVAREHRGCAIRIRIVEELQRLGVVVGVPLRWMMRVTAVSVSADAAVTQVSKAASAARMVPYTAVFADLDLRPARNILTPYFSLVISGMAGSTTERAIPCQP